MYGGMRISPPEISPNMSSKSTTRVERRILKYFNLLLALLMFVVFSLNIEQLMHNKRMFQPDNYKIFKIVANDTNRTTTTSESARAVDLLDYPGLFYCRQCQESALVMLNQLNSKKNIYFNTAM